MRPLREAFPYQTTVLNWTAHRRRIGLFLEMRLGKSAIALRWLRETRCRRPLIVAPLTTIPGWIRECRLEGWPSLWISKPVDVLCSPPETVTLTHYEAVRAHPALLSLTWFDAIVLDESTRIKNPKAQITHTFLKYCDDFTGHRAILSGLPAPESELEYFTQMRFLLGGPFLGCYNYWQFRNKYFERTLWSVYDWVPKRGARRTISAALALHCYSLKRSDVDVGGVKLREFRSLQMNPTQRGMYRECRKWFQVTSRGEKIETKYAPVRESWLGRIAGGFDPVTLELIARAKTEELVSLLRDELRDQSVVVWCRFNAEIHSLFRELRSRLSVWGDDRRVYRMTGLTPLDRRANIARHFAFGRRRKSILLIQIKLGLFGLDLSAADTAVYYSNSYSMQERNQSEDRIIHPLKKSPALILDLVTAETVDEIILKATQEKSVTSRALLRMIRQHAMGE